MLSQRFGFLLDFNLCISLYRVYDFINMDFTQWLWLKYHHGGLEIIYTIYRYSKYDGYQSFICKEDECAHIQI